MASSSPRFGAPAARPPQVVPHPAQRRDHAALLPGFDDRRAGLLNLSPRAVPHSSLGALVVLSSPTPHREFKRSPSLLASPRPRPSPVASSSAQLDDFPRVISSGAIPSPRPQLHPEVSPPPSVAGRSQESMSLEYVDDSFESVARVSRDASAAPGLVDPAIPADEAGPPDVPRLEVDRNPSPLLSPKARYLAIEANSPAATPDAPANLRTVIHYRRPSEFPIIPPPKKGPPLLESLEGYAAANASTAFDMDSDDLLDAFLVADKACQSTGQVVRRRSSSLPVASDDLEGEWGSLVDEDEVELLGSDTQNDIENAAPPSSYASSDQPVPHRRRTRGAPRLRPSSAQYSQATTSIRPLLSSSSSSTRATSAKPTARTSKAKKRVKKRARVERISWNTQDLVDSLPPRRAQRLEDIFGRDSSDDSADEGAPSTSLERKREVRSRSSRTRRRAERDDTDSEDSVRAGPSFRADRRKEKVRARARRIAAYAGIDETTLSEEIVAA